MKYREGTSALKIIEDGWSRDFKAEQILEELHLQGYVSITIGQVKEQRRLLNEKMEDFFSDRS